MMTRTEFIELQIGACEARKAEAHNQKQYYYQQIPLAPDSTGALASFASSTNAATLKCICETELEYWRSQLEASQ